ncbi:MAG TPA: hypothetical protein V6C46_09030, partial [Coleofasciculaceae cyanobacterium]
EVFIPVSLSLLENFRSDLYGTSTDKDFPEPAQRSQPRGRNHLLCLYPTQDSNHCNDQTEEEPNHQRLLHFDRIQICM